MKGEVAYRNTLRDDQYQRVGQRIAKKQAVILADMHAAGVKLLPGSAAPHPWLLPGRGFHDELGHWERAGIPAADVLRYATLGAAEILGIADERGSLAPGKVALNDETHSPSKSSADSPDCWPRHDSALASHQCADSGENRS